MPDSSHSSDSAPEKQMDHDFSPTPDPNAVTGPRSTEANAMPETAAEPHHMDLEKAEIEADLKPTPPNPMDPSQFPDG